MSDLYCTMPVWCNDCDDGDTWHQDHYWVDADGSVYMTDESGNLEDGDADLPTAEAQEKAWREYSEWVLAHGKDPLGNFFVKHAIKTKEQWQFRFAKSILGPLLIEVQRTGKRYHWTKLPEHLRIYLKLSEVPLKSPNQWASPSTPPARLGDFATWADLIAAQPDIKEQEWWTVTIEHDLPRPAAAVARELRAAARKALAQREEGGENIEVCGKGQGSKAN